MLRCFSNLSWLVADLPLWKIWKSFVSWDDEIPNWMESHKNSMVPNNQPAILLFQLLTIDSCERAAYPRLVEQIVPHDRFRRMPEEVPELPVHCIIQCHNGPEAPEPPLTLYNTMDRKLRNLLWHCIIQWTGSSGTSSRTVWYSGRHAPEPPHTVDGKLRNLLSHCMIQWSGREAPEPPLALYNTVDGKLRNLLWHCIIQWTGSSGTSSGTV